MRWQLLIVLNFISFEIFQIVAMVPIYLIDQFFFAFKLQQMSAAVSGLFVFVGAHSQIKPTNSLSCQENRSQTWHLGKRCSVGPIMEFDVRVLQ